MRRYVESHVRALLLCLLTVAPALAVDVDGDGYEPPADCNDASVEQAPGLAEACDGIDNDCDGLLDESGCPRVCAALSLAGRTQSPTSGPEASGQATLAWNGTGFGMAWTDDSGSAQDVRFVLLDAAGVPQGPVVPITSTTSSARNPALAWTGAGYGLAWVDERDGNAEIYVQAVSPAGAPQGSAARLTAGMAFSGEPALIWGGEWFLLAWTEAQSGNKEIVVARLGADMGLLSGLQPVTSDAAVSEQASLAWGGSAGGVAWTDERDGNREIYFRALDATGAPTASAVPVTADAALSAQPSLAWIGNGFMVAWTDDRDGNREIYLQALAGDGAPSSTAHRLTDEGNISDQPSLVWNGAGVAVAWRDTRVFNGEIYLAQAGLDGTPLGQPLRVSNDLGLASRRPDLIWTGSGWSVAWDDLAVSLRNIECLCQDADGDGVSGCGGDCDDGDPEVYPGASQICDGKNNDCSHASWPALAGVPESDDDGDGLAECDGDCDDGDLGVYPGAPEICDGKSNDCTDPEWPGLKGLPEDDGDGDGFSVCDGDCDDALTFVRPGGLEMCNGLDDDCDSLIDEDGTETDPDADGVPALCDLCRAVADPDQSDADHDGVGDACDLCPMTRDAGQTDRDADGLGDLCDLDDGYLVLTPAMLDRLDWGDEARFNRFDAYRGDLRLLRSAGAYTQPPGGLADQGCGLTSPPWIDNPVLQPGEIVHYLVASGSGSNADDLGVDSSGMPRTNASPCP